MHIIDHDKATENTFRSAFKIRFVEDTLHRIISQPWTTI